MTFWEQYNPQYQMPEDEQVLTEPFLMASQQLLPFFTMLGKAFSPLKSDIGGNIQTLHKKFLSSPEKCVTIKDLLQDEFDNGMTADKPTKVALACLWLRRALDYICLFLKYIEEDYRNGEKKENICGFAQQAYKETLMKYHGWIVQKVFSVFYECDRAWIRLRTPDDDRRIDQSKPCERRIMEVVSHASPYRKDFMKALCYGDESLEEKCYNQMQEYVQLLSANSLMIGKHLKELNLDSDAKV